MLSQSKEEDIQMISGLVLIRIWKTCFPYHACNTLFQKGIRWVFDDIVFYSSP